MDHYYKTFDTNRSSLGSLYQDQSYLTFEGGESQVNASTLSRSLSVSCFAGPNALSPHTVGRNSSRGWTWLENKLENLLNRAGGPEHCGKAGGPALPEMPAPHLLRGYPALPLWRHHGLCHRPAHGEMQFPKDKYVHSYFPRMHICLFGDPVQTEGEANALKFSQIFHLAPAAGSYVVSNGETLPAIGRV